MLFRSMPECITSLQNPHIQKLRRLLGDRRERDESGLFVAEGRRLCEDAMAAPGIAARAVYGTERQLRDFNPGDVSVYEIADALAAKIGETKSPQGIFVLCEKPAATPFVGMDGGKYLLLHDLQDPGNIGAIIRTAEALGIDALLLSESCPDLFGPKVLRAGMGGSFRLSCHVTADISAAIKNLRESGVTVCAAALTPDAVPLTRMSFPASCAVLIGNEGNGLPGDLIALCDAAVEIPMRKAANSLNAAAAAAILIWEMTK